MRLQFLNTDTLLTLGQNIIVLSDSELKTARKILSQTDIHRTVIVGNREVAVSNLLSIAGHTATIEVLYVQGGAGLLQTPDAITCGGDLYFDVPWGKDDAVHWINHRQGKVAVLARDTHGDGFNLCEAYLDHPQPEGTHVSAWIASVWAI